MTEEKPDQTNESNAANDFANEANEEQIGLVREFIEFLGENKKWWLLPIIVVLLLFGALFLVAPSVAPFIYTLF